MLKGKGIISDLQKNILISINKIPDADCFYLSGGTALSEFYLGHRLSYDLDIFTSEKNIINQFSNDFEKLFSSAGYKIRIIKRFESFVEISAELQNNNIIIHVAQDSPFRFSEPVASNLGIKINNYKDLITDKVLAYFGRWEYRDAVDLYFILQNEQPDFLMDLAKEKDPGFDLYWFAISLIKAEKFPDDIGKWPVDMLINISGSAIKNRLIDLANDIMKKIKK